MIDKKIDSKGNGAHKGVPSRKGIKVSDSSGKKIKDLKIELLKNPTKKASIKKEIARLLTMEIRTKSEGGKK